jgi:hypothetical protein
MYNDILALKLDLLSDDKLNDIKDLGALCLEVYLAVVAECNWVREDELNGRIYLRSVVGFDIKELVPERTRGQRRTPPNHIENVYKALWVLDRSDFLSWTKTEFDEDDYEDYDYDKYVDHHEMVWIGHLDVTDYDRSMRYVS